MATKMEVIKTLLRVGTVEKIVEQRTGRALQSEATIWAATTALTILRNSGEITHEEGQEIINVEIATVMNEGYEQAQFDADQKFLNENIDLLDEVFNPGVAAAGPTAEDVQHLIDSK